MYIVIIIVGSRHSLIAEDICRSPPQCHLLPTSGSSDALVGLEAPKAQGGRPHTMHTAQVRGTELGGCAEGPEVSSQLGWAL